MKNLLQATWLPITPMGVFILSKAITQSSHTPQTDCEIQLLIVSLSKEAACIDPSEVRTLLFVITLRH